MAQDNAHKLNFTQNARNSTKCLTSGDKHEYYIKHKNAKIHKNAKYTKYRENPPLFNKPNDGDYIELALACK